MAIAPTAIRSLGSDENFAIRCWAFLRTQGSEFAPLERHIV
jgi:hypothetical protein